jgi:hypothetical protein
MEAVLNWVQAMLDDGHVPVEIRVDEPWAGYIISAGIVDAGVVGPAHAGLNDRIEFITADRQWFAVLST